MLEELIYLKPGLWMKLTLNLMLILSWLILRRVDNDIKIYDYIWIDICITLCKKPKINELG